jgi:homocysteine S-methyltransferase
MPNAGTPRMVEGRYFYVSSPEYMATYAKRFISMAGVRVVGGCCGTTPEHIRAVRDAIRSVQPRSVGIRIEVPEYVPAPQSDVVKVPTAEKSRLAKLLSGSEFVVSVEMRPPRGLNVSKILEGARVLREHGVHAVNLPDGALASARVSPAALARVIEGEVGIETIVHWCCRDRNLLGIQADLLGAQLLGQNNLLAVTGDPPKLGDYPSATAVYDIDSIGLVRLMNRLNHGEDLIGKPIGPAARIHIGVGVDPASPDLEDERRRFRLKVESGAEFVMTQPVFDVEQLRAFLGSVENHLPPVLVGILPLTSYRNAEFYLNEVPGMHIPQGILDRMRDAGEGDGAAEEGVRIAQESLAAVRNLPGVRGAYLMPPFGRYKLALRVLEVIRS